MIILNGFSTLTKHSNYHNKFCTLIIHIIRIDQESSSFLIITVTRTIAINRHHKMINHRKSYNYT